MEYEKSDIIINATADETSRDTENHNLSVGYQFSGTIRVDKTLKLTKSQTEIARQNDELDFQHYRSKSCLTIIDEATEV